MPLSAGSCLRSWVNASSPPAEAPTPTMGNAAAVGTPGAGVAEPSPSTPSSPVEPAESSSMSFFIAAPASYDPTRQRSRSTSRHTSSSDQIAGNRFMDNVGHDDK